MSTESLSLTEKKTCKILVFHDKLMIDTKAFSM